MDDLAIEVCGENGAYYKAYIVDLHDDGVSVAFENDWQPQTKFPFRRIRLPPAHKEDKKYFAENQAVEVFSRANEQEACGWWKALIKMTKGGFHVVEYVGWKTTYTEIVPSDRIRLKNTNLPINKNTFKKFELEIPEDLREYAKLECAHKEFKKAIGAAICRFDAAKNRLIIVSKSNTAEERAGMLSEMHFRSLRQKILLLNRTEEAARQLESEDIPSSFKMSNAEDMSCFTFTWEIENFCLVLESDKNILISPVWKTETNEECAWWKLQAYIAVSNVYFDLKTLIGSTVLDKCQLFLISSCGEILLQKINNFQFYIPLNDMFCNFKSKFPNDILTLCCKMGKKTMKVGECHHHSMLQKVNYSWCYKQRNPAMPNHTFFEKNNFLLYISVQKKAGKNTHTIVIGSVPRRESYVSIISCNLIINDGLGHVVNKEHIYPYISWKCEIDNFKENNPGSGLQFQLNCVIQIQKNHIPELFSSESSLLDSSGILNNDLLQIYKEETFSDTTLTTEGKSFPAHRNILAARSPVFSAMLKKKDMSEGREGVVVIDDIDSDTMNRMLVFLYSDSLEEMNWEEASALYYAADKYAIQYLKQKCANVLKSGLAVDNSCHALILADTHSDQELMKCTIDFIRDHQEVISSAEWEFLEDNHSKLAAKTVREVFVRK